MPLFRERVEIFREQHGKLEEEVVVVGMHFLWTNQDLISTNIDVSVTLRETFKF